MAVSSERAHALSTPPMVQGLPFLGSLLDFRRDHVGVFEHGYRDFGPVFGIRLGPQRGVVLIGPKYHEFFFSEVDQRLSVPEVYRFVIPMFGEVVMAVQDRERRRQHVAVMQSAFKGRRLTGYVQTMVDETDAWLDELGDSGTFEVWDALEALSMNIAASALMGPEVREQIGEFRPLLDDLARGMDFVLPPNLPLPRFRRRDRARKLLTEMIRPVLANRRERLGEHGDFLQMLVTHPALYGKDDDDETLVGIALCTIFTGFITTAAQTAWALVLLLQHPEYLESVLAELDRERVEFTDGECPTAQRLSRLNWALTEAVRLHPVMSHYARTTAEEYMVDGYRVPSGWLTMLCPAVAHRLPSVFSDPERYDPERFGPGREEHRRHPYALIGFSGGFYRCPGSGFGMAEMRVVLAMLLDRYSLELRTADPVAAFDLGVSRPGSPCLVRYSRRSE
jgi:sterol 14-demethylase